MTMRLALAALAALCVAQSFDSGLAALAQDGDAKVLPTIPKSEYAERRAALLEKLGGDGVVVIAAEKLLPGMSGIDANTPKFDYTYLAGYHAEGDLLVIVSGEKEPFIFTNERVEKVKGLSGVERVLPRAKWDAFLKDVLPGAKTVFTRVRAAAKTQIEEAAPDAAINPKGKTPAGQLTRLRMVKSKTEIEMMKKAADATNKAHIAAMKACRSGLNEGELQKVIEDTFKKEGCDGLGFPSIVGSGKNGTILHYMENSKDIPEGTLVVCDIGASHQGYVTDITRTLPTDGKYSDDQKAAYQCVLDAQKAAEKILKPGVNFGELEAAAQAVFAERKLTKWSYAHARDFSVRHGLGHFVGLSVHDSGVYQQGLPEGAVITIEPGWYDKDKAYGIRIEDIYLVTKDGFERWSAGAPREVEEIEKIMAEARRK